MHVLYVQTEHLHSVMSLMIAHLIRHKRTLMALFRLNAAAASMTLMESPKRVSIRINTRCSSCRSVGRVVGAGSIGPYLRPRGEETAEEEQGAAVSIILSAGEFCHQPFTLHF